MRPGSAVSRAGLSACLLSLAFLFGTTPAVGSLPSAERSSDRYIRQLDDLSALWSYYKQRYIVDGRVVSWDEQGITTSEGQGYAMLRAVWSGDRATFDRVWTWTNQHLQIRQDKLFAWKWKDQVVSANSATDADTDIALALILAARRFDHQPYEREALAILTSIWDVDLLHVDGHVYVTAGNWARHEEAPVIHVAYLAPYAYEVFASVDPGHPWRQVIADSYALLHWLYDEERVALPPELVYWNKTTQRLSLRHPKSGRIADFSYDAFPIFWRVAQDVRWFGRAEGPLRQAMLAFFEREWKAQGRFLDRYQVDGTPRSSLEALPLYATVQALALETDPDLARRIRERKLTALQRQALAGKATPYYLHNWLWFSEASALQQARHYDEFLGFLRPFDVTGFLAHFPLEPFAVALVLFFLARRHPLLNIAFLVCAGALCLRYLWWRLFNTLNVIEPGGLFISLSLWIAECYAFSTILLLLVQVGVRSGHRPSPAATPSPDFTPSVDVLIPIYSESCAILERTLIGAAAMAYEPKRIYVLDDSHRDEVRELAHRYGAQYLQGPRRHAKAGNLNRALAQTAGELVVVFDTDHIPVTTFLRETVPFFADPRVGFVQTPHHFYNQDIFQRALRTGPGIPNEQDMFNHAIQGGRHSWGGSFFVGSGAVFRRAAIMDLGGFKLLSITEDIHTSQHLHARGWRSVFLDKDLAVGLTAETLGSYLIQRRRWMLGCLQIFFKDNPLLCRGLSLRHRLGYFASLYYFFFPAARVVFWITPLYFLLFHLHPIFSDVSVLMAYLLPFLLLLPMMSSALLPGWPRLLWSTVYESTVCFPLFRSMFDLFLPKRLGFSVTPKGLVSHRHRFDWRSSFSLVAATALTLGAMAKGLWEFWYFGIEKDAYFFNLSWAGINLVGLSAGLLMAWERPQRRAEERIRKPIPFRLEAESRSFEGRTDEISPAGCSFTTKTTEALPSEVSLTFLTDPPFTCRAQVVYHERLSRTGARCGLRWIETDREFHRRMVLTIFSDPSTWAGGHNARVRNNLVMAAHLIAGLLKRLVAARRSRRRTPRTTAIRRTTIGTGTMQRLAIVRDHSASGIGLIVMGRPLPADQCWTVTSPDGSLASYTVCYRTRLVPFVWRYGARPSVLIAETPPQLAASATDQT
ncbi:glycosyl hydrolase family 8 [Nitrospira moscoviensis]|uniref:cellulase n=1 Tax=Nitrospira moscoviensis TaxID=42253 RepID=A0A0K2G933_NITMO|nr:glycosyl hydrolase family 8 [Nitrospira moscoviensis]ALA57435.1 Glycosyl transferase family 2 [Nitrospira moscoviensis]